MNSAIFTVTLTSTKGRPTSAKPPHRILREVLRHYLEFRDLVSQDGRSHVIEHGYFIYDESGENVVDKRSLKISFWDLHGGLKTLSARKREAVFYNVILDWKQKDVAARMGITTVSVGQYVDHACQQLSKRYFAELYEPCLACSVPDEHVVYDCPRARGLAEPLDVAA